MSDEDSERVWARCRAGKKWFWCVWIRWTDKIIAHGKESTVEECEQLAMAYAPAYEEPAGYAINRRKQLAALRRKHAAFSRQQCKSDATIEEFVVVPFYDSDSGHFMRHRIVKRTERKIFIEEKGEACNGDGQPIFVRHIEDGWEVWSRPMLTLDRQIMERDGSVWHRGSRERYWDSLARWQQERSRTRDRIPACLSEALVLDANATKQEARAKFKKLLAAAHPDHGGSSEEFQKVHTLKQKYPSVLSW